MLTDADWNELVDTLKARVDDAVADIIGSGTPKRLQADGTILRTPVTAKDQLVPGDIYADGVRGELCSTKADPTAPFNYSEQADFPEAPALPANSYLLYADLWERPVTALEDDTLRDAGLHGADTCSRTQTMVQVKWCPLATDPLGATNPGKGNAAVTVAVRSGSITADPCDPCASEVSLKSGVGDYLFRVEIHDVQGPANAPTRVTVKWSTENASECHATATPLPPDFSGDQWAYELFNATSERHLGIHLASGANFPVRGTLVNAVPASFAVKDTWIRRWDGYATFARTGTTWSLVLGSDTGRDGGLVLSTTNGINADGHVAITNNDITIVLRRTVLTLKLGSKTCVAGDHWLATVRQNEHSPGEVVVTDALPTGIVHHYVKLATVDAGGNLQPLPTAEIRRLAFPKLSELMAEDVGYKTDCTSGLFTATQDTVKKALDRLCSISAGFIAYTPACTAEGKLYQATDNTVQKALDRLCNIQAKHVGFTKPCNTSAYEGAVVTTVEDALKLLCDLKAAQIRYEPGSNTITKDAKTVQQALDLLCTYIQNVLLDNAGRLALFGRGVLCGLIPALKVVSTDAATGLTTVELTAGRGQFIDGQGGLRRVDTPLTTSVPVPGYEEKYSFTPTGNSSAVTDIQNFAKEPRTFSTGTLQPAAMAPFVTAIGAKLKASPPVISGSGAATVKGEIAAWVKGAASGIQAEFADKIGEIIFTRVTKTMVPAAKYCYLCIDISRGGPALAVRVHPPVVVDNVPGRMVHPPGDIVPVPGLALDAMQTAVWAPYRSAHCPQANDGCVYLGTIGVYGGKAFICPDYREQIIFTPAQAAAEKAGEYQTQKVAARWTADEMMKGLH
jgi:hypothetical protein